MGQRGGTILRGGGVRYQWNGVSRIRSLERLAFTFLFCCVLLDELLVCALLHEMSQTTERLWSSCATSAAGRTLCALCTIEGDGACVQLVRSSLVLKLLPVDAGPFINLALFGAVLTLPLPLPESSSPGCAKYK